MAQHAGCSDGGDQERGGRRKPGKGGLRAAWGSPSGPKRKLTVPQHLSGCDGPGQPGAEGMSSRLGTMAKVFLDQAQCLPSLGRVTGLEVCGTEGQPLWAPKDQQDPDSAPGSAT